ncbi:MAG: FliH/SctL family protein [Bryobacter sp.]|nr:FliH/SctL family protein [Bryobacter sp.]
MSTNEVRTAERTPAPAGRMSRILSVEEAQAIGLRAWTVEDLDGSTTPGLVPVANAWSPGHAPAAENPTPADWSAEIERAAAQHQRELQEAIERTRREAEARFKQKLEQEVEPWLRRMAASIEDIATVRQRYLAESEEKVVRLAVAIAQRILHREVQIDSLALLGLLRAAIEKSEMREMQKILLNPQDLEALRPHLAKLNLPPRVEIAAERGLERGALLVESTSGTLDASIDAQLDEVERGFIDMLGKRG